MSPVPFSIEEDNTRFYHAPGDPGSGILDPLGIPDSEIPDSDIPDSEIPDSMIPDEGFPIRDWGLGIGDWGLTLYASHLSATDGSSLAARRAGR